MSVPQISCADDGQALLGEGACWDAARGVMWWVDIRRGRLHRHAPEANENESWPIADMLTCAIPLPGAATLIAATRRELVTIDVGARARVQPAIATLHDFPGNIRFNDANLDPVGHLWIGTMDDEERDACGRWFRYDPASGARAEIAAGFGVTNGPAFDPVNNHVYLTDSAIRRIYRGTFDPARGCRDLAPWRDFQPDQGYPDGMTIAPDGTLWVAFWDCACVRQFDGTGRIITEIALPVRRPTSISFATPTQAFVTSAAMGLSGNALDGALLSIRWC